MKNILCLGAGLVARPFVQYLCKHGYHVTVASRTKSKAEYLIEGCKNAEAVAFNIKTSQRIFRELKYGVDIMAVADQLTCLLDRGHSRYHLSKFYVGFPHVLIGLVEVRHKPAVLPGQLIALSGSSDRLHNLSGEIFKRFLQIFVRAHHRHAAHRDVLAQMLATLGELDAERTRSLDRVFEEQLEEIAHAVEEEAVRIGGLDLGILRHHRRHAFGAARLARRLATAQRCGALRLPHHSLRYGLVHCPPSRLM